MSLILQATSAHKAWTKLATIYVNQSWTRVMDLKDCLAEVTRGSKSVIEYMQIVQIIKDELAIINVLLMKTILPIEYFATLVYISKKYLLPYDLETHQ